MIDRFSGTRVFSDWAVRSVSHGLKCLLGGMNPEGQEGRERFAGATEAFARRNFTGGVLRGDHLKHKASDDVPSSKDVVRKHFYIIVCLFI